MFKNHLFTHNCKRLDLHLFFGTHLRMLNAECNSVLIFKKNETKKY